MPDLSALGRLLLGIGALLGIVGLVFMFGGKFLNLGKLPGDILIRRGNFTFYFPLMTGVLLSIVLSIILNLLLRR